MLCVSILYISDETIGLKSTPNDRFFEKLFHGNFIYSQSFCQKSAARKIAEEILFVFCFDVWPGVRILAFRLYCDEIKIINKRSKNKNNELVYMTNK